MRNLLWILCFCIYVDAWRKDICFFPLLRIPKPFFPFENAPFCYLKCPFPFSFFNHLLIFSPRLNTDFMHMPTDFNESSHF